jgi:hypothetical protein
MKWKWRVEQNEDWHGYLIAVPIDYDQAEQRSALRPMSGHRFSVVAAADQVPLVAFFYRGPLASCRL